MPKRDIELRLAGGLNTDSNPDVAEVQDCDNVVPAPDGSGIVNREGSAIYHKFTATTSPTGRIAELINSRPPNLTDGSYLSVSVNTGNNNRIESLALVKPRTNLAGDTLEAEVYFEPEAYTGTPGSTVSPIVKRAGSLDRVFTVDYATENGTAVAGTDYTAATGTLTFAASDVTETCSAISITNIVHYTVKSFSVLLSNPSTGANVSSPARAIISIGATSGAIDYAPVMYGSISTTASVVFYTPTTGVMATRVLTGIAANTSARVIRCGDYCGVLVRTSAGALILYLYSLTAVSGGTLSPTRSATVVASGVSGVTEFLDYQYPGGLLYLTNGTTLYEVVLATGVVTPTALSGLTGYSSLATSGYKHGRASSDGYLLLPYATVDAGPTNRRVAKVNPNTAAASSVSGLLKFSGTPGTVDSPGDVATIMPLPSGESMTLSGPNNETRMWKFDTSLNAPTDMGAMATTIFGTDDGTPITAGGLFAVRDDGASLMRVYNAVTGASVGSSSGITDGVFGAGSVELGGTVICMPWYSSGSVREFRRITASTGASLGDTAYGTGASGTPIPDAFGYEAISIVTPL